MSPIGKRALERAPFLFPQFGTCPRRSPSENSAPVLIRSIALLTILAAASAQAAPLRVVFVDNRAQAGGIGTAGRPFATIDEAIAGARDFEVMHVAETDQPYLANLTLRRGQMLIGSAYGLDAIQTEFKMELDVPPPPAAQGPGPLIRGSVGLSGDNVVAGGPGE